ncbi:MAG TPA: PAS domain S-box protein [Gaiellaceae bacterium]|nr:PAS domain S-box protein [Gaiellaceae bacterium]
MGGSANVSGRLEAGDADLVDALVDTAQCLVCILDPHGRIVRFNELCERATGYTEAEVLGRDIRELFIPPEHIETFSELLELVWTTHTPSPRAGEWVTRDGSRFPVVWSNRPLTDAEGRPRLFVSAGVDLSGRDVLHTQLQDQLELTNRLMEEQAALRRVATLVASGPDPSEVFRAVSAEAAGLMAADAAGVLRFDPDEVASVVGRHELADLVAFPVGGTIALGEDSAVARVFRTGSTAKIDAYEGIESEVGQRMRLLGITSSVAAPIYLHNRLWGAIVASTRAKTPPETWIEKRLTEFAGMVSLALAGADNRRQLLESRERIVRASDDERRRLERNLHDGAQQRLVGLAILLRLARARLESGERPADLIDRACDEVEAAIEDLRTLAQGLHPPLLTQAGVGIALRAVGRRLPIAVEVEDDGVRFPPEIEAALFYVAAEALTNTVKHAAAETAGIRLEHRDHEVRLRVADDGRGGAVEGSDGSGLRGLRDRVEALRGSFDVASPQGGGTTISVSLPLRDEAEEG